MAEKPVPNPQRLKKWPVSVLPKDQDKAAGKPPAPVVEPEPVVAQETQEERIARQHSAPFGDVQADSESAEV